MTKRFKKLFLFFSVVSLLIYSTLLCAEAVFESRIKTKERNRIINIANSIQVDEKPASIALKTIFNHIDKAHEIYSFSYVYPDNELVKIAFNNYKSELNFMEKFYKGFLNSIKNAVDFYETMGIDKSTYEKNLSNKIEEFNSIFYRIKSEIIESYTDAILKFY